MQTHYIGLWLQIKRQLIGLFRGIYSESHPA
jgi:hypothetical protein